ncbi:hypothetical protein P2H44_23650 [Albimonas sp. CAU 1670]|uniref:hypothetical protein n=1 Tax=Albimonas sp. CAU 1670 TaxID=3032599 RepID=UPI0023DC3649|nr:hypothetical protein [Albimonas sp. CAU 1670]MDF2235562.1 hypothetical protein [Albimonas sp. CAU 1670]
MAARRPLELELEPGERLLWRGRPVPRAGWGLPQLAGLIVGGPTALGGIWMAQAQLRATGGDAFAALPALVAIGFGLAALIAGLWYEPRRRAATVYVLTDRRGAVLTRDPIFGRTVMARPILEGEVLELKEHGDGSGSVWFHRETFRRSGDDPGTVRHRSLGFLDVEDPGQVFMLIRGLRDAAKQG